MKITIEKAEAELTELQKDFESTDARIRENNGQKSRSWLISIRGRIFRLEEKIKDMKANRIRTDKKTPEDIKLEKKINSLESALGIDVNK